MQSKNHEHTIQTIENTYAQQRQNIAQTFDLQKRSVRAETDREDTEQQEKFNILAADYPRVARAVYMRDVCDVSSL